MRVLVGAFGTRGDVQPALGLAQALLRAGHSVVVAVPPSSRALAEAAGLTPTVLGLDYEVVSRRAATGSLREVYGLLPLVRSQVREQYETLAPLAASCDLFVGTSVFAIGALLSETLHKPSVFVSLCPNLLPSGFHPPPTVSWQRLPKWLNRFAWWFNEQTWQLMLGGEVASLRAQLGLSRGPGVWRSFLGEHVIVASDPALSTVPADATGHEFECVQVGALTTDEAEAPISAALDAFLAQGPPPVFIGFGSMSDPHPRRTTSRLMAAGKAAGVRLVISRGWAGLESSTADPDVFFAGPEPHRSLFPRCAAIVHHGGAGTLHAAAASGVPQVLMPQLLDQHYWAHHLQRVGISTEPVERHGSSSEPLAKALRRCVSDTDLITRAKTLKHSLRRDGLARTVALLEKLEKTKHFNE